MVMVVDRDARNLVATRVLRVEQPIVRLMVEERGVSTWVVLKVLRGKQIIALPMVVVSDVGIQVDAPRLHGESQGFALGMVVERGVRLRAAPVVLKGRLVYASLMGVDVVASTRGVTRVRKGALCSARRMVVESAAYFKAAQRVLKVALPFARDMVGESVAFLMAEAFARKVFMEVQISVLLMVVGRDVLCQAARKVRGDALIVVLSMVEVSVVSLRIVGRVPKAAQTSARLMVGERGAVGERANAKSLLEARVAYVLLTAA